VYSFNGLGSINLLLNIDPIINGRNIIKYTHKVGEKCKIFSKDNPKLLKPHIAKTTIIDHDLNLSPPI